jgi:hypothetical protein
MGGGWILPEEFLNGSNHIHRLAPPADTNGQADAAVFVKNIQKFQSAAIHSLIKLKINRPYMVRVLGPQQRSGAVRWPSAFPLARQGSLQPFLTPDPLHPLVIDLPALHSQAPVDQPPAPAHMAPGQLPDATAQLLLLDVCQRHGAPMGIAVLTRQTAGMALGNPESILQNHDSSAATFRA